MISAVVFSACSKPIESCFSFSPETAIVNQTVTFNASCSQNASYFIWNFGDNTPDTLTSSLTISHKFLTMGQFTVTLTAERKDGATLGKDKLTTAHIVTVQ